jgi:hypothetical protein
MVRGKIEITERAITSLQEENDMLSRNLEEQRREMQILRDELTLVKNENGYLVAKVADLSLEKEKTTS